VKGERFEGEGGDEKKEFLNWKGGKIL
jgi:hypothetical protein